MDTSRMDVVHSFKIITDGKTQTVKASAMGISGGEAAFVPEPVEPMLTVKEQDARAKSKAKAKAAKTDV